MRDGAEHRSDGRSLLAAASTAGARRGSAGCAPDVQTGRRRPARRRRASSFQSAPSGAAAAAESGRDRPRHHVADADVVVAHLLHQRFAERVQAGLRRAVGGAAGKRVLAGQAADVDDPAAAALPQVRNRGVAAVEDAAEVRVDDRCQSASVMSATFANTPTPALLTRTSSPPKSIDRSRTARSPRRLAHVGDDAERACGPSSRLRALEIAGVLVPVIATEAPRRPSASAIAKPMPFDPPVTSATMPSSRRRHERVR